MTEKIDKPSGKNKLKNCLKGAVLSVIVTGTAPAIADEVFIAYLDAAGQEQGLIINASSSEADNALAAELILEGVNLIVTLDDKEDLDLIAAGVSAQAPDSATATAISNTILGVGALLGGRSIVRSSVAPVVDAPPVATPPVPESPVPPRPPSPPSPPAPSSSVVSPN